MTARPLTETRFAEAVDVLCGIDDDLAGVVERFGTPVQRRRPAGFATLVLLILEQQVSLASAAATFRRLEAACAGALESHSSKLNRPAPPPGHPKDTAVGWPGGGAGWRDSTQVDQTLSPEPVLALDDEALRTAGLSRQKARYVRALADAAGGGALDIDGLARLDDAPARDALMGVTGIGGWTADVYLMMALGRPDIWPVGDLALAVAAGRVKGLDGRPGADALDALGEGLRPWRAVAAQILWHYYLSTVRRGKTEQGK